MSATAKSIPGESSGAGGFTSSLSSPRAVLGWAVSRRGSLPATSRMRPLPASSGSGRPSRCSRPVKVSRALHAHSTNRIARPTAGSVSRFIRAPKPVAGLYLAAVAGGGMRQAQGVLPCR